MTSQLIEENKIPEFGALRPVAPLAYYKGTST